MLMYPPDYDMPSCFICREGRTGWVILCGDCRPLKMNVSVGDLPGWGIGSTN